MRALRAMLLAALLGGVLAAPAAAAPYTVWSCRDAAGAPLSTAAWIPAGMAGSRSDSCGSGGSLSVALSASDTAPGAISGYRLDVPRDVTISGYTAWIAAETAVTPPSPAQYVAGLGQGDELAVPAVLDGCHTSAPTCTFGTFSDPLSPANEVTLPVLQGGLALMAACASATDSCVPDADPPACAALFRSAVELDDPAAPAVDSVGGTIAAAAPVSGVRTLVADLSDVGSGVRRAELLVDGAVVDRQDGHGDCASPFTVADPCPRSLRAVFVIDTAALSAGAHTVAARALDAAGNAAESAPLAVDVVHPTPTPPPPPAVIVQEPPARSTLRLEMPRRVRLPTSRSVRGAAVAADGAPRAGIRLRFQQRPFDGRDGDWRDMRATAVTDAAGRFRVPVPADSAQVRALAPSSFAAMPAITAYVRPLKATIGASRPALRNGDRLTLRGRLRHAGGAADGRTVLIQSRVRGTWRSVDSIETGANGTISWRYRFTSTRQTARYRFRFVVPRMKRLPWKRLVSRQVSVVVYAG